MPTPGYSHSNDSIIDDADLHEYTSGPVLIPKETHPITGEKMPITMGHEFSGIIEAVGDDVNGLAQGQRAVVRPTIFDENCSACKQGCEHCCRNIGFIGLSGMPRPSISALSIY